jgi:hypothetical protein
MLRPTMRTNGVTVSTGFIGIDTDFTDGVPTGALVFPGTTSAVWDTSVWDTGVWGSDLNVSYIWQGANGMGYCAAVRLTGSSNGIELHWASTDFVMTPGAIL